jgi:hypothetical protein
MKIISLSYNSAGYACSIASSIKKKYNNITNFFDYLVVDMKTINDIINLRDLNLLLNNHNFEDQITYKNKTLIWNNFSKMISYHDLVYDFDQEKYNNFKIKYLRRYYRLMNDLYNEKIIFFIRFGKTEYNEIKEFINNIKNINSKLIIYFINVDYDEDNIGNIYYDDIKEYIYINFKNINIKEVVNDDLYFRSLDFNWEYVFNKIGELSKIYN